MKVKYIAIEREYGSGGTEIAQRCAQICGVNVYGKEIIDEVSRRVNLPANELENYEQRVSSSFLYSLFLMKQSQTGDPDLMSNEARLFVEEAKAIKDFAHNGPAIFVGHCATHILNSYDGVIRVFIRSSEEFKSNRAIEKYLISPKSVDSVCRQFNKKRSNYYAFCTQKKWDDMSNYDIVLDSSKLGIEKSAELLAKLFE